MILSASMRTDIPALYGPWLLNRLKEGFALTPYPYRSNVFRRLPLGKEVLDCIVFWSKNPEPFFPFLPELEKMGIPFYFQFTLNPYGKALEQNLPSVEHRVKTFLRLGEMLGSRRLVWRYDPVIINGEYSVSWHQAQFEKLCGPLSGAACRCVFSFYDR